MHDRPRVVHAGSAQDQPHGADRGAEQGEAAGRQGHLSAQGQRVEHDGHGRTDRHGRFFAAGRERVVRAFNEASAWRRRR